MLDSYKVGNYSWRYADEVPKEEVKQSQKEEYTYIQMQPNRTIMSAMAPNRTELA